MRNTSSNVSAMTATNATVRRPWNVRGINRRSRAGNRDEDAPAASALGEGVPDTSDRQDEGGDGGVVLDLVAQVAHVDVDRLLVLVERLVVAQQLQQLGAGVHASRA